MTNSFRDKVEVAEARGASAEELRELLGRGRAKKGIFEGDLEEGELEIGQVAALFRRRQSVDEVMKELLRDTAELRTRYLLFVINGSFHHRVTQSLTEFFFYDSAS